MKWQPINTAPKSKHILICVEGKVGSVWIACDNGMHKQTFYFKSGSKISMEPTHWMPLPEPPEVE